MKVCLAIVLLAVGAAAVAVTGGWPFGDRDDTLTATPPSR
jgi:hypothetical protein